MLPRGGSRGPDTVRGPPEHAPNRTPCRRGALAADGTVLVSAELARDTRAVFRLQRSAQALHWGGSALLEAADAARDRASGDGP